MRDPAASRRAALICLAGEPPIDFRSLEKRAVSSAVEHCFHTAGATGSIPVPPTIQKRRPALSFTGPRRDDRGTRMDGRTGPRRRPAIIGGQGGCSPEKWTERWSSAQSSKGGYEHVGGVPIPRHAVTQGPTMSVPRSIYLTDSRPNIAANLVRCTLWVGWHQSPRFPVRGRHPGALELARGAEHASSEPSLVPATESQLDISAHVSRARSS